MIPSGICEVAKSLQRDPSELERFLLDAAAHYETWFLQKKEGGKRRIDAPSNALKRLQRGILHRVLKRLPSHRASHCRAGRSIVTNAQAHLGQRYVGICDLSECFPSTGDRLVRNGLSMLGLDWPRIRVIARLCMIHGRLPQGAPTSPALLDAALYQVDDRIENAAARAGLRYTRYMDDIAVSGNQQVRGFLAGQVAPALAAAGYGLAAGKTRFWGPKQRAIVTGIMLARRLRPSRGLLLDIRSGLTAFRNGRWPVTNGRRDFLLGKISAVGMVWPAKARHLRGQLDRAIALAAQKNTGHAA